MASDFLGWTRTLARRFMFAVWLIGAAGVCIEPAWSDEDNHRHSGRTCLIVDTDVATDDFRAFAVLFPHRDLTAVVVTEGISSVPRGSAAIALFLASGQSLAPVIPGLAAAAPPVYDWLPQARMDAERINKFLPQPLTFAVRPHKLKLALAAALQGCRQVDVLVLGPWTSFVHYAPMLRHLTRRVVASGRPLLENNPDNFNCVYDQQACNKADDFLRKTRNAVWVDLPADGTSYPPTTAMVNQLNGAGMPGLLRAALNTDISTWDQTRLWDDTAALYVLNPEHFRANGLHLEPAIDEATLRSEWVKAVNATPDD